MTPYQEAKQIANQIVSTRYDDMFVTMSWGGEYTNSEDVEADTMVVQPTVKQLIQQVQKRLNELGNVPHLDEDGIIGRLTLNGILSHLPKKKE
jgi:hypothetical protein